MLLFLYAQPSLASRESFQVKDEITDLLKKVEDDQADLEDQTIHWFAAVICVNMGKKKLSKTWNHFKISAACLLLLFALSVTRIVFGELRTQELNSAKDKFWNFVFYKVTFT